MEQVGNPINVLFYFTAGKVGKTGLTDVTASICCIAPDLSVTTVATNVACTELSVARLPGWYGARLANAANEGDYGGLGTTADGTVDLKQVPSLREVGHGGVEHINADISSRAAPADLATIASEVAAIATAAGNLDAPVSTRATPAQITAAQTAINSHTDVAVAGVAGGGGSVVVSPTYFAELTDGPITVQGVPRGGVYVLITADEDGEIHVTQGTTLPTGLLASDLALNPGDYFAWPQLVGFVFDGQTPTPFTVPA